MADQPAHERDAGPGAWPGLASGSPPALARERARRPRIGLALTAAIAGLTGLVVSLVGVSAHIMPRHFTVAEQQKIISWEIGKRWRTWPAGQIFPQAIRYRLSAASLASDTGLTLTARRVGIAAGAPCGAATDSAATDSKAAAVLAQLGCRSVLRASYMDATRAFVTTVGVAVMPSPGAATAAQAALPGSGTLRAGVRAAAFPGTLTEWFDDQDRQVSMSVRAGPYLVMYAAGYADGRPSVAAAGDQTGDQYVQSELLSAAQGIASHIAGIIGAQPPPPRCPGAPGC